MAREVEITRISPLAALRVALALSLVGLVAWILCVTVLYFGMDAAGVWSHINSIIGGIGAEQSVSFSLVISVAALGGAVVAFASTLLAPVVAVIYNATVDIFGGLRVSLADTRASRRRKH